MSHEIRSPMTTILGFAELLRDSLCSPQERTEYLRTIHSNGNHLLSLINDILDLSKIEAGRMELLLEPASASDIVHGVASVMHGMAAHKNIRLEVETTDDLPPIVADPRRVKQILYNLVSNAIKFSGPGLPVFLRARLVESGGLAAGRALVPVRGRGSGPRHPPRGPGAGLRGVPPG